MLKRGIYGSEENTNTAREIRFRSNRTHLAPNNYYHIFAADQGRTQQDKLCATSEAVAVSPRGEGK